MELKDFIKQCQRMIEIQDMVDYGNAEMATKLGVTEQTYGKYKRGEITPRAAKAILRLLSNLDDTSIVKVIRHWEKESKIKEIE